MGYVFRVRIALILSPVVVLVLEIRWTVGNDLAQFLVREVMHQGLLRFSLRLPFLAAVAEVPNQLLLFRIYGNDRQALLQEALGPGIHILKLSITVGMLIAFQSLGISLQAIPHLMKESGHLAIADAISLALQLLSRDFSASVRDGI